MFECMFNLFSWVLSIFSRLPPETKQKLIDIFADALEHLIREYYRTWKQNEAHR